MYTRDRNHRRSAAPFIIELVGPAGAGKTTLARVLTDKNHRIMVGPELELRKIKNIPTFLTHAPYILPVLARRRRSRRLSWDEIKSMVYLRAWSQVLARQVATSGTTVLLDHGPAFKLATLHAFGPESLKSRNFASWWHNMYRIWASTLDFVVWLDAPDDVLVQRINKRDQRHPVKQKPKSEVYEFLARYRHSYKHTLDRLTALDGPTLIRFDSSRSTIGQMENSISRTCDL